MRQADRVIMQIHAVLFYPPLSSHTSTVVCPQVPNLVRMAKQAIAENKCCVIGLQSTGEARTQDVVAERGEELDDFVSGPRVGSNNL